MTQTFQSGFKTTLALICNPTDVTLTLATVPTVTSGRLYLTDGSQEEWMSFTGVSGSTVTGLTRGLSQTADPATAGTGLQWIAGTRVKLVAMHDQLPDKQQPTTFTQNIVATDITFTGTTTGGLKVKSLTTAQRTGLASPANGMIVYDSTIGENYQYISGVWSAVSAGSTQPNASETVAGKVEEATQTQLNNGDATGETGARLFTNPSKLPTAVASYVTNNAGVNAAVKAEALEVIDDEGVESIVDRDTYLLGEPAAAGDSLFVEDMVTFASLGETAVTDDAGYSFTNSATLTAQYGIRFQAKKQIKITSVTKEASCTATRALIKTDTGNTTLATATFVGNVATFATEVLFATNDFFRIELDNSGGNYTWRAANSPGFPINKTNVIYNTGSVGGANDTLGNNISSISTTEVLQNLIGNVTANTRVSIPVIGSGVAASTLKLALRKYVSPSVDLGVRIETDNAGSPSGTLLDANATATVLASALTTSLVDTTVTLAGSVTLVSGTKYWIVLFAGTYGAETVNGTNYFGVGYRAIDTTTRIAKTFNGTVWSAGQATRFYYSTSSLFTAKLLSKTDATYSYKLPTDIPRIATESKGTGQNVIATTLGFNDNFSGLTPLADYYLSNTPGAISMTAGTNFYTIGSSIDANTLYVNPQDVGYGNSFVITSSNAEVTTLSMSLVKVKEILCNKSFTFNVYFEIKINSNPSICTGRIYVNGVAVGTSRTNNTSVYVGFEEYITVSKGDLIQIYMSTNNGAQTASLQNFRLRGGLIQPQGMNNVVNI